jgi:hypothetical protein
MTPRPFDRGTAPQIMLTIQDWLAMRADGNKIARKLRARHSALRLLQYLRPGAALEAARF